MRIGSRFILPSFIIFRTWDWRCPIWACSIGCEEISEHSVHGHRKRSKNEYGQNKEFRFWQNRGKNWVCHVTKCVTNVWVDDKKGHQNHDQQHGHHRTVWWRGWGCGTIRHDWTVRHEGHEGWSSVGFKREYVLLTTHATQGTSRCNQDVGISCTYANARTTGVLHGSRGC